MCGTSTPGSCSQTIDSFIQICCDDLPSESRLQKGRKGFAFYLKWAYKTGLGRGEAQYCKIPLGILSVNCTLSSRWVVAWPLINIKIRLSTSDTYNLSKKVYFLQGVTKKQKKDQGRDPACTTAHDGLGWYVPGSTCLRRLPRHRRGLLLQSRQRAIQLQRLLGWRLQACYSAGTIMQELNYNAWGQDAQEHAFKYLYQYTHTGIFK